MVGLTKLPGAPEALVMVKFTGGGGSMAASTAPEKPIHSPAMAAISLLLKHGRLAVRLATKTTPATLMLGRCRRLTTLIRVA